MKAGVSSVASVEADGRQIKYKPGFVLPPLAPLPHSNVDRYNVVRYSTGVTLPSPPDARDLPPLPVATFHILVAVADQDRHGYAIMQDVAARTNGALKLSPGTLYGAIRRMLDEGLIVELSDRQRPEQDDERRRYYRITAFGRSVAQAEVARLATLLRQAKAVGLAPARA
jgi:DNA-binding PadR family transcriptional regulator